MNTPGSTYEFCSANLPCWMTAASKNSFLSALSMIFSSTVPSETNRKTWTGLVCPRRWARSMACRSTWGFQSLFKNGNANTMFVRKELGCHKELILQVSSCIYLSYKMTISAVAKLMPSPPALVLSRKQNLGLPSALNSSICESRFSPSVLPSILQYWYPTNLR